MTEPTPWRFIATDDVPDVGILRGDVVIAFPGKPTRVFRTLPVNPGLLLNLAMQDVLAPLDGVIGTEAVVIAAMEQADRPVSTSPHSLRVVR